MGAMGRPFLKMNGLGNDFVVVDARSEPFRPSADEVRAIAGRAATLELDGGELQIEWAEDDNHVFMTGPVELEYTGELP